MNQSPHTLTWQPENPAKTLPGETLLHPPQTPPVTSLIPCRPCHTNFIQQIILISSDRSSYSDSVLLDITAAKAGSEIIVFYNVKSILTDNSF